MSDEWTVSASKVKAFDRCQEEFRLRYMEGHEERGPDNRYLRRGNAVHEAVERTLEELLDNDVDPTEGSDGLLSAKLISRYRKNGGQAGYELSDEFDEQVVGSLKTIARFLENEADGPIRGIEKEVEFGVDRDGIDRDFGGYMDLATADVIDWKTGKSEDKSFGEMVQGAIYMAGYAYEFGEPPERVIFAYVNPSGGTDHPKMREIDPGSEMWESTIDEAQKLLAAVRENEFDADPGPSKCHWCDFETFCTVSDVGAGGIDWWTYP